MAQKYRITPHTTEKSGREAHTPRYHQCTTGNVTHRRYLHSGLKRTSPGVWGRVERSRTVFRSALYSPFAPAFRSWECHNIRPCTGESLPLTEAWGWPSDTTCGITAQASSYGHSPNRDQWHQAFDPWEGVSRFVAQKALPRKTAFLAAAHVQGAMLESN